MFDEIRPEDDYARIERMINEGTLDREFAEEMGIDFDAATNNYPDDEPVKPEMTPERRAFIRSQIRPFVGGGQ